MRAGAALVCFCLGAILLCSGFAAARDVSARTAAFDTALGVFVVLIGVSVLGVRD